MLAVTTTNVGLISRDICARPNTILLETTKAADPEDVDSLVMIRNGPITTIRYLFYRLFSLINDKIN